MASWRRRYWLRKRWRKQKPLPFRYVLLLSFVFMLLSTATSLWIVHKGIKPSLLTFVEAYSITLATSIMNQAIREEIGKGLSLDEVIKVVEYENETITTFDAEIIMDTANRITTNIVRNLNTLETGKTFSTIVATEGEIEKVEIVEGEGIQFEIPLGRITNNVLLSNLGPKIPVVFRAVGDVEYDIETEVIEQPINRTWIEIWLHMEVGIHILVPFTTDIEVVQQSVPLAMGQLKGEVPQFYSHGGALFPAIDFSETERNKDINQNGDN